MSHCATVWAMETPCPSPTAKLVLLVLADAHNGHTGDCYPSLSRIADIAGLSEGGVKNGIRALEAAGLLKREVVAAPNNRTQGVKYHLELGRGHLLTPPSESKGEGASPAPQGSPPAPMGSPPAPSEGSPAAPKLGKEPGNSVSAQAHSTNKILVTDVFLGEEGTAIAQRHHLTTAEIDREQLCWLNANLDKSPRTRTAWLGLWENWCVWFAEKHGRKAMPKDTKPTAPTIHVSQLDSAWELYSAAYRQKHGKDPPTDRAGGWHFPIDLLPAHSTH
jgi:hypothetical protein